MCCCNCCTRKIMLIIMITFSVVNFIFEITAIACHGSRTGNYKSFLKNINNLETNKTLIYAPIYYNNSLFNELNYNYLYTNITGNYNISENKNSSYISYYKIEKRSFSIIKYLKSIEIIFSTILLIFIIFFIAIEFFFFSLITGDKEYTLIPVQHYNSLNNIKIFCIVLSILCMFIAISYSILLIKALSQYIYTDNCSRRLIVNYIFSIYNCYHYIFLTCFLAREKYKFNQIGNSKKPGPEARYYENGDEIIKNQINQARPTLVTFNQLRIVRQEQFYQAGNIMNKEQQYESPIDSNSNFKENGDIININKKNNKRNDSMETY